MQRALGQRRCKLPVCCRGQGAQQHPAPAPAGHGRRHRHSRSDSRADAKPQPLLCLEPDRAARRAPARALPRRGLPRHSRGGAGPQHPTEPGGRELLPLRGAGERDMTTPPRIRDGELDGAGQQPREPHVAQVPFFS